MHIFSSFLRPSNPSKTFRGTYNKRTHLMGSFLSHADGTSQAYKRLPPDVGKAACPTCLNWKYCSPFCHLRQAKNPNTLKGWKGANRGNGNVNCQQKLAFMVRFCAAIDGGGKLCYNSFKRVVWSIEKMSVGAKRLLPQKRQRHFLQRLDLRKWRKRFKRVVKFQP